MRKRRFGLLDAAFATTATLAGGMALEIVGVPKATSTLESLYDETLKRLKEEFLASDGPKVSFDAYLDGADVPTKEEVEAVVRIIDAYEYPVRFRSGFSFFSAFGALIDNDFEGLYHSLSLSLEGQHSIWLKGDGLLTRKLLTVVVAEISHAYQNEYDTPYKDSKSFADPYNTPGNTEYEAHKIIQPLLENTLRQTEDRYRNYVITIALESKSPKQIRSKLALSDRASAESLSLTPHTFTKNDFYNLLAHLENYVLENQTLVGNELVLELLASLPSSGIHEKTLPDKKKILVFSRSDAFYNEFMLFASSTESATKQQLDNLLRERYSFAKIKDFFEAREDAEHLLKSFQQSLNYMNLPNDKVKALRESGNFNDTTLTELVYATNSTAFTYTTYKNTMLALETFVSNPEQFRRKNEPIIVNATEKILTIVNEVCLFNNSCSQEYGVHASRSGESPVRVVMDKHATGPHFNALRYYFYILQNPGVEFIYDYYDYTEDYSE
jgi:hypothetical protein